MKFGYKIETMTQADQLLTIVVNPLEMYLQINADNPSKEPAKLYFYDTADIDDLIEMLTQAKNMNLGK